MRLWLWFIVGFLLVFIGLAAAYPIHFFDGRAVYATKLWHYYFLEIRQAWSASGNLGPTSGNAGAALGTAAIHVLFAVLGGAVAMAFGWFIRKSAARG
jgi:hypothetical protein